jgi:hypothetical protein
LQTFEDCIIIRAIGQQAEADSSVKPDG